MKFKLATPYGCRYCDRRFAWPHSLRTHEARCPSLALMPNEIKEYRMALTFIRDRLKGTVSGFGGAITKGEAENLIGNINRTLTKPQ